MLDCAVAKRKAKRNARRGTVRLRENDEREVKTYQEDVAKLKAERRRKEEDARQNRWCARCTTAPRRFRVGPARAQARAADLLGTAADIPGEAPSKSVRRARRAERHDRRALARRGSRRSARSATRREKGGARRRRPR